MCDPRFAEVRAGVRRRGGTWLAVVLTIAAFGATEAVAQDTGTVTGIVLDASTRQPVAGAQVSISGTNLGTLANNVGRFLIPNVPSGAQTVAVQFIGYAAAEETVQVPAGGTVGAEFEIRGEAIALEGVIVTGTAGQARRREVGNSISQVSSRDIEIGAITDMGDVLQGRAAGVQVNDFSGQVGAASQIRLRGNNSLTQTNNPLIYVDGVRIRAGEIGEDDEQGATPGVLDMVNPNDIERVEIVKGPAATTLYGTEAAGGVIQVFTKRGVSGAPAWTFSMDQGVSRMGHVGGALNPESINPTGLGVNDCSAVVGCPESGSWLRNGHLQRYNLSVRGGSDNTSYFVSGRWGRQEGVVNPQGADDYSIRGNVSFQPLNGLDISLTNSYSRRNITWIPDGNNAGGFLLNVMRGTADYTPDSNDSLVMENDMFQEVDNIILGGAISWMPNNTWSHRLNVGMDYTFSDFVDHKPWGFFESPEGDREDDQRQYRNMTLDYSGTFSLRPHVDISSNFSWGGQLYENYRYTLNGFDNTFAGPGDVLLGDGTVQSVNEDRVSVRSGGFFLQEALGWKDKLFLTGGVRWDGFSTFGEGFGLAAYPKVSLSYLISDESFWPTQLVETLKLRAAWGQSGRAPEPFDAERLYEATTADEQEPGVIIRNLGNPDLGPETSTELEYGFEASALQSRVVVDFTVYDQTTDDALICLQEAPSFGTEECTWQNLGETENWGTETELSVVPVRNSAVDWTVGVGYSTNDSEIIDLGNIDNIGGGRRVGFPVRIAYDEVVQNPNAVGELPELEQQFIGNLYPTSTISLSTRLMLWRSLTLDLLGEGQYGMVRPSGPAYQNMRRTSAENPVWPYCVPIIEQWENEDTKGSLTALQVAQCVEQYSDQGVWTGKADFFKLRSATLSYRLPQGWVPGAQSAQLSIQGKNLLTFTDYFGLDPEAQDNGFGDQTPNEYYTLPPPRTFIVNLRVNF